MKLISFWLLWSAVALSSCAAEDHEQDLTGCQPLALGNARYTVCRFDTRTTDIRLFLNDKTGVPYGNFDKVATALAEERKALRFAMNGGMYHADRRPVGYYVEKGVRTQQLMTKSSYGNFGMVPNGVFYRVGARFVVQETLAFQAVVADQSVVPEYATQSGPMLVIDGALHPKFIKGSPSRKRRNGVGISGDGHTVYFAISETAVNFYTFASLFKDQLKTPNALFLDGTVSKIHDSKTGRSDTGLAMGPIVGVVE